MESHHLQGSIGMEVIFKGFSHGVPLVKIRFIIYLIETSATHDGKFTFL